MNTAYSYEIQPLDEHSISIERVYGTTPVVVIPEQIDGFTVKRIGAYCFSESKHVPADAVTIGGVDSFMKALCGNDIEEILCRIPWNKSGIWHFIIAANYEHLPWGVS